MKHPASQHLFDYWNALRAGRAAPERNEMDPAAVRGVLADMLIVDVQQDARPGEPEFPIRLSGTRVNALFGSDLKGRCLLSLWKLRDRADLTALIRSVLDDTRPAVAGVGAGPLGDVPLPLELLLLPLRHKGKTHARLLGALSPGAVPAWLGVEVVAPLSLGPHRMIDPRALHDRPLSRFSARTEPKAERHAQFVIHQGGRA